MNYCQAVWYQILGEPAAGKTLLATVITRHLHTAWVIAPQEESLSLWEAVGYVPDLALSLDSLPRAFEALKELHNSRAFEALVLDALPSFGVGASRTITRFIKDGWFRTRLPIYVINQTRQPYPPGGQIFHSLTRIITVRLFRRRPFLYAYLGNDWLFWNYRDAPAIRPLREADHLWVKPTERKEST